MKDQILNVIALITFLGFVSCSKEKNCVCTTQAIDFASEVIPVTTEIKKTKKECSIFNETNTALEITRETTCVEE